MLDELENNREAGIAHTVPADRPCGRPKLSRYRNIHCLIWNDDKFPFLSDDARLVWFHLFTNPITTPIGIYKASLSGLAEEIHWPLARYKKAFAECSRNLLVRFDERCHVVLFPQFFKWNKPANPNVLSSWVKCYEELPDCDLKIESIQSIKEHSMQWGEPFAKVTANLSATLPLTLPKQEQQQQQFQEQYQQKEKDNTSPPAEEVWPSVRMLVKLYNDKTPGEFPSVSEISPARIKKAKQYLSMFPKLEFWETVFSYCDCRFLRGLAKNGNGHENFVADFDWLLSKGKDGTENCVKVAEGKYLDKMETKPHGV